MRRVLVLILALAACSRGSRDVASTPRVVSLTPSATEVVGALGATASLVGVDTYSKYPAEVTALPKVGDFLHPNLEAIVRLAPTLVIVDDVHGATANKLHEAHIATVECAMHGLADVEAALRAVGGKLDKAAQAEALVAEIDRTIADARAHQPAKHPRVLVVIDREAGGLANMVAAGPGSWLDDLLAVVGGDNVLAGATRYPKITIEEVVRTQPDIILDLSFADDGQGAWAAAAVPAVKTGKVVRSKDDFLLGPSPRVSAALVELRKIVAE